MVSPPSGLPPYLELTYPVVQGPSWSSSESALLCLAEAWSMPWPLPWLSTIMTGFNHTCWLFNNY